MEIIYDEDLVDDVGDLSIVGHIIGMFHSQQASGRKTTRVSNQHVRRLRTQLQPSKMS